MNAWDCGMAFAQCGGTLDELTEEITKRGLNAADGQAFTLGYLEGVGVTIAAGSREAMDEAGERFARPRRRK